MLNEEMSAGTNAEQSKNDETQLPSSPTIGNTNVIGSQCLVNSKVLPDKEKCLKIKEVLNGMSVKDAIRLLYDCRELIEKESKV